MRRDGRGRGGAPGAIETSPCNKHHENLGELSCDSQFDLRVAGNTLSMTLTSIIILNVVLDLALLAGLAFAMTRAIKLTPHRPGITGNAWRLRRPHRHAARSQREERLSGQLARVYD
jgi:hypothetical protein